MIKDKFSSKGKEIYTVIEDIIADKNNISNYAHISPYFNCPDKLANLGADYIKKGYNKYSHVNGLPKLCEQISEKVKLQYSNYYNPEKEITITAGATQAIYTAISSIIEDGDEAIIFEPTYNNYVSAIEKNGGKAVFMQLKLPSFFIDWEEVKKGINARTKLIIINTPHNPTGAIFSAEDLEQLKKLTNGTKIIILSDEVFEHIIFNKEKHQSIAKCKELVKKTIIVSSFALTFNIPGWKIGYCMAPEKITKQIRKAHSYQINSVNTPLQHAIAKYLETSKINYSAIADLYQEKRDYLIKNINNPNLEILNSRSGLFLLISYKKLANKNDTDYVLELINDKAIALFPLSVFYHDFVDNKILGLNFANSDTKLGKVIDVLNSL
ncbi:MAG: aminotransferase class I/II-fold pyridoxal phosphate-dependent enzyme [Bacteroidota bacterium]|nr:aminotransferase class I/II-fold pyridoxal phosphate-dependent enzyme [Bacteroidota bacterium]